MIGYAFQFGTQAAATTMEALVGLGSSQAQAMVSLLGIPLRVPFHAMHSVMEFAREAPPAVTMPSAASLTPCPEAEILAAYADCAIADQERAPLEAHLVHCRTCRRVVAEVVLMTPPPAAYNA